MMSSLRAQHFLYPLPIIVLIVSVVIGAAFLMSRRTPLRQWAADATPLEGLNVFGEIPDFSLIERSGRPVHLNDLRGSVWVADVIYTACTDTCPLQSGAMARLQRDLSRQRHVRLVSITVDPQRDTPQVLSSYAERYKADPERWLFLTGKKREIYRLATEGLRLGAIHFSQDMRSFETAPIVHSSRFVLVDAQTRIRGYYDSSDAAALERLRRDVGRLVQERG